MAVEENEVALMIWRMYWSEHFGPEHFFKALLSTDIPFVHALRVKVVELRLKK